MDWLLSNPEQTNALAAVGSVVVSFLALIVAGLSIFYTVRGLALQRKHNELSVVPVPFVALADYENLIRVKIRNDGIGPMLVKKIGYEREGKRDEFEELVMYMPALPAGMFWSNFSSGYVRSIQPGAELTLLELEAAKVSPKFIQFRDECRRILDKITVRVEFTDVYNGHFEPVSRDLSWFGRRLASSRAPKKL